MTIAELMDAYEPRFRDAFLAGIAELTSQAQIGRVTEALERGDIEAALAALYIDRAAYAEFEAALAAAYGNGGAAAIANAGQLQDQTGARFVFRFNVRDMAAEQWLREHSSELITRIVDDQREAVRNAMQEGLSQGQNPRPMALDIVGRVDRQTQRRTGGLLGLSAPQERAVSNARQELVAGDYAAYLQRAARDKRFDSLIRRAIRDDKPLTKDQISRILGRYSDRLLKIRGDTIARTEALTALHASQYEAVRQLVATGKVRADQVTLEWDASRDLRTRFTHIAADGQKVKFGERFLIGGKRMLYPGDPAGGPNEVINCRCALRVRINYLAGLE